MLESIIQLRNLAWITAWFTKNRWLWTYLSLLGYPIQLLFLESFWTLLFKRIVFLPRKSTCPIWPPFWTCVKGFFYVLFLSKLQRRLQLIFFYLIFLRLISRHLILSQIELMVTWSFVQLIFVTFDLMTVDLVDLWPFLHLALLQLTFLQLIFYSVDLIGQLIFLHLILLQLIFLPFDLFVRWSFCQLISLLLTFLTNDLRKTLNQND